MSDPTTGETPIHDGQDPEPIPDPEFLPGQPVRLRNLHEVHRDELGSLWTPSTVKFDRTVEAPGHRPVAVIKGTLTTTFETEVPLADLEPLEGNDE